MLDNRGPVSAKLAASAETSHESSSAYEGMAETSHESSSSSEGMDETSAVLKHSDRRESGPAAAHAKALLDALDTLPYH